MSELLDLFGRIVRKAKASEVSYGYLGDEDGLVDVPGRPSFKYVRRKTGGEQSAPDALEDRYGLRTPGFPVSIEIDPTTNREYIAGPGEASEVQQFIGERPVTRSGFHTHTIDGDYPEPVETRRLLAGLVYVDDPTSAPLTFRVTPHAYWWNGALHVVDGSATLDATGDLPATSGMQAWVGLAFDTATDTFVALTGDEQPGLLPALDPALIEAIDFGAYKPYCAVRLRAGQTTAPVESDFYDLRDPTGGGGGSFGDLIDSILTDDDGEILVDDDGNVLVGD
jgi:hypothetical protein